ncbi:MAG TPA: hypothetical protein VFY25_10555 [Anaerolineales bacterium]|nr:hypothetical protein [Anaerolineales bacterium]
MSAQCKMLSQPAYLLIAALILRMALEDGALQQELPGFREFTQKRRCRLFPRLW